MITLSISIFIYQLLTLVGILSIGQIVKAFASKTNDIDIQLMYSQKLFSIFRSSKKFKMTRPKRFFVYAMTAAALGITFLPTLLSLTMSADYQLQADFSSVTSVNGKERYINLGIPLMDLGHAVPTIYLVRTKFFENFGSASTPTFASFLESFIRTLGLKTEPNPTGIWFKAADYCLPNSPELEEFHAANRHIISPLQVNANGEFKNQENKVRYAFGKISDENSELASSSSSSLKYCVSNNYLYNLTDIEGHKVQAVNKFDSACLPVYDPSLTIRFGKTTFPQSRKSILDTSGLHFRKPGMNEGYSRTDHLAINTLNGYYENTVATLAIKKSTHITEFYRDLHQPLVNNCTEKLKIDNSHIHYTLFPDMDKIICTLEAMAFQNTSLSVIQATKQFFRDNHAVNAVYTYFKNVSSNDQQSHGFTADLTYFSVYDLNMNYIVYDDDETIVSNIVIESNSTSSNSAFTKFPQVDSQHDLDLVTDLVLSKNRLYSFDGDYFKEYRAKMVPNVNTTNTLWLVLISTLPAVFLGFIILAGFCISKPYQNDLRTLLIESVKQQEKISNSLNRNRIMLDENMKFAKIDINKHNVTINDIPLTLKIVEA